MSKESIFHKISSIACRALQNKQGQAQRQMDDYLFLGLPAAGKTTYFTVMAQTLQDLANKSRDMNFRFENDETREFIRAGYGNITAPEPNWPDKTMTYDGGYEFSLRQRINVLGLMLPWEWTSRQALVRYHDYPGEAFEAAFGQATSDTYKAQAEEMRVQIQSARGVFLLMDADKLFNGGDRKSQESTTEHLFKFIHNNNPNVKLAILFNKLELFEELAKEKNFKEMFRDHYGSAYAWLPPNVRFFDVYPIGKLDVNENGYKVPAREIVPRGVLEPVQWMIGFKGRFAE